MTIDFTGPFPRKLRGDREAVIVPLTFGRARITVGRVDSAFVEAMW
jgi:hypothetical protein